MNGFCWYFIRGIGEIKAERERGNKSVPFLSRQRGKYRKTVKNLHATCSIEKIYFNQDLNTSSLISREECFCLEVTKKSWYLRKMKHGWFLFLINAHVKKIISQLSDHYFLNEFA